MICDKASIGTNATTSIHGRVPVSSATFSFVYVYPIPSFEEASWIIVTLVILFSDVLRVMYNDFDEDLFGRQLEKHLLFT